jgi:transposase
MIKPEPVPAVPRMTAKVAKAAFPKGNLYLRLREEFGVLYQDADFAELFSSTGQPGIAPWRLALVTVFQFLENLSDRQAADAVRSRIDWKYALSLELNDCGFDYSVLSEFRTRLVEGGKSDLILDKMLAHFKAKGLLKKRGKQRTDSTHVLGHVRFMSRLELLGETMRAALNQIATVDPEWLHGVATEEWHKRYDRVVDGLRLPESKAAKEALGISIGEDGFALLDALEKTHKTGKSLLELDKVQILKQQWVGHYKHTGKGRGRKVRMRDGPELARAADAVRSPYETEVRYCTRGGSREWIGYKVHLTETCDEDIDPHPVWFCVS